MSTRLCRGTLRDSNIRYCTKKNSQYPGAHCVFRSRSSTPHFAHPAIPAHIVYTVILLDATASNRTKLSVHFIVYPVNERVVALRRLTNEL